MSAPCPICGNHEAQRSHVGTIPTLLCPAILLSPADLGPIESELRQVYPKLEAELQANTSNWNPVPSGPHDAMLYALRALEEAKAEARRITALPWHGRMKLKIARYIRRKLTRS